MLFKLGLTLLFFLPIIESVNRTTGLNLLLIGSFLISSPFIWRKKIYVDLIDYLWIIMLILFAVSTITSWSLSRSYLDLLRYFAYFLIFLTIRNYSQPENFFTRFYIPMIIINSLILSFLSLLYFIPQLFIPKPPNGMNLFYPTFGHNHLADILIFTIPLVLFFSPTRNNFFGKIWKLLSAFFILILFLTTSRGALFSLTFAVLIFFIFRNRINVRVNKTIIFFCTGAILILVFSFFLSNFFNSIDNLNRKPRGYYKPAIKDDRINYLVQSLKGFQTSPILGTGLDTFRYVSQMYREKGVTWTWYVHNHYAEIFLETGIFGGLIFLSLIFLMLIRSSKNIDIMGKRTFIGLYIALLSSSIKSMIDSDWQFLSVFLFFFMGVAFLLSKKREDNPFRYHLVWKFFLLVIIVMFSLGIFLPLDSASVLRKSDYYITKFRLNEAKIVLERTYRLDKANIEVMEKLRKISVLINDRNHME